MMRKIRCGIIGSGFVGPHHLDAIRRLGFVEEIDDLHTTRGPGAGEGRGFHVPKAFGDYHRLLEDPDIEVVDIVTPTHAHHSIALGPPSSASARRFQNSAGGARIEPGGTPPIRKTWLPRIRPPPQLLQQSPGRRDTIRARLRIRDKTVTLTRTLGTVSAVTLGYQIVEKSL